MDTHAEPSELAKNGRYTANAPTQKTKGVLILRASRVGQARQTWTKRS